MNFVTDEHKFLESYKKKIIKETLKTLYKNYKIYDDDDNLVDIDTIQKEIFSPKIVKRCIGTTNTSPISQCNRNAIENYDYCKTHLYKMCLESNNIDDSISVPIEFTLNNSNSIELKDKLKKKFIEDTFYFIDSKFIYDDNYIKVGYIHNNEYILTSNPFLLDNL
jgi:hypothetical protein